MIIKKNKIIDFIHNFTLFNKNLETALNTISEETFKNIISDHIDINASSIAIYDINHNLVYGNLTSSWCKYLNSNFNINPNLQDKSSDRTKTFCCINCCRKAATLAINLKKAIDFECEGGSKIYAVPIFSDECIKGSISVSYNTSSVEFNKLRKFAYENNLNFKELLKIAETHNIHSDITISNIKKNLSLLSEHIGLLAEKQETERCHLIFSRLMNISINAISINSIDNEFLYINPSFENMWGYSADELKEKKIIDLVPFDNRKTFHEQVLSELISKGNWNGKEWLEKKDGSKFLASITSTIVKSTDNTPIAILFTFIDITEQEKTKVALEEREITLRNIYDSTLMGFFLWDADGEIIDSNETFLSMLGYTRKEFFTQKIFWQEIIPPEYTELYNSVLFNLAEKKDVPPFEEEFICKDSTIISVLIGTIVLPDPKLGGAAFVLDITKRKMLEEHLQQAEKMEAIGHLSGGIAHDFNNILSIILANTEIAIKQTEENSQIYTNLEQIKLACLRAKEVVQQLLFFARKTKPSKRPINIKDIVKDTLKLLRATIPASITVTTDIPDTLWTINADPAQINQFLINLCTNAVQSMDKEGGNINIKLSNIIITENEIEHYSGLKPGNFVEIDLSDTGHGIEHENLKKIFEPYFTTRPIEKGTGLGLSVVHGIIKDLNGFVTVDSILNKGTTFKVLFPAVESCSSPITVTETLKSHTEKANILFIDDEKAIVKSTVLILKMQGYKVTGLSNPVEAYELILSEPDKFDLVITDMTMPGMTGDILSKKILEINSKIPIILCTGFNDKIEEETAKNIGIKKYIEKPLTEHELSRIIEEVLSN